MTTEENEDTVSDIRQFLIDDINKKMQWFDIITLLDVQAYVLMKRITDNKE